MFNSCGTFAGISYAQSCTVRQITQRASRLDRRGSTSAIVDSISKWPILVKRLTSQYCVSALNNGGEGGIRTPGPLRVNGFQDRRLQPLGHLSEIHDSFSKRVTSPSRFVTHRQRFYSALSALRFPAPLESRGSASCLARSAGQKSTGPLSVSASPLPLALRANAVLRRCSASLPAIHVKTAAFNHSATSPKLYYRYILGINARSRRLLKQPKTARFRLSVAQICHTPVGKAGGC